ncbi:MAG: FAD-dependent oxidoreductase [Phycisphaeraceae bacterium]
MPEALRLDVVIFGGGVAGLWTLAHLKSLGYSVVLLESRRLGQGQTVSAQGILHGGVKYTLSGMMTDSARAHRDAPTIWQRSLAGEREPLLTETSVLTRACLLWRTTALSSIMGMVGARAGLSTRPIKLDEKDRPAALAGCPGEVFRVDEWVIDPVSMVRDLSQQHSESIVCVDADTAIEFGRECDRVTRIEATSANGQALSLAPEHVILTAGSGNRVLREWIGLAREATQKRPLHMLMMRGELPEVYGHCVDGAHTRATITSGTDRAGRRAWQVGGQVSEDGVKMEHEQLLEHGKREVGAVLPGLDLSGVEWSAYRVDRAEATTRTGMKPDSVTLRTEGNVHTAFPTKLVLAPYLASKVAETLPAAGVGDAEGLREALASMARPEVALAPWDEDVTWTRL